MISLNVMVIGCGRVGSRLAEALEVEGHKVVVVDNNSESFGRLPPHFRGTRIQGDALDRDILIKANIEETDAIACVTNSDSLNAIIAIAARQKFKVPKQVIRVFDPVEAEGYRRFGIPMISPTELGVNLIKDIISHPSLYERLTIGSGEVRIIELPAPSGIVGRSSDSLNVPGEISVVAIMRQGKAIIPGVGLIIQDNDILTIGCVSTAIKRIEELLI